MASGANRRAHNTENYQLPGTVQLLVREKGSTSIDDWISLGNIVDSAFAVANEILDHFSNYRGQRAKDRSVISERNLALNFTIDEVNAQNLQFVFNNFQARTASSVDKVFENTFANPGGGGSITVDTTGNTSEISVKSSDHEVNTVFVGGGVDYTYTPATGVVAIEAGGALNLPGTHPELHITWEKNFTTEKFEGNPGLDIELEVQFAIMTSGGTQYVVTALNSQLKNNGDLAIGDGSEFQTFPLQLDILADEDGKQIEVHVVDRPGL